MAMRSPYKSESDRSAVARWCRVRLAAWPVAHRPRQVDFDGGTAQLTLVGDGEPRVVFVPGTNFNAATSLAIAEALGRRWPTAVVDLPGQPGLSSGERPRAASRGWYGRVLKQILDAIDARGVVAVGHSLGAAVLLTCDSNRIAGRVLVSPAGIVSLRAGPGLMLRSTRWLLGPTPERTRGLLAAYFTAPGVVPPEEIVEWMTLLPKHCRSTLAPPPLHPDFVRWWSDTPHVVATGAHDYFVPPARLAPAVSGLLGSELHVIADAGHLVVDERPGEIADLVAAMKARNR